MNREQFTRIIQLNIEQRLPNKRYKLPAREEALIGDDGEVDGGNEGDNSRQQPDEATDKKATAFANRQPPENIFAEVGVAGLRLYRHPTHFDERPPALNGHPHHEEGRRRKNSIERRDEHMG